MASNNSQKDEKRCGGVGNVASLAATLRYLVASLQLELASVSVL